MLNKKKVFIAVLILLITIGFLGAFANEDIINQFINLTEIINITEIINLINLSNITMGDGLVFNGSELFATAINGTSNSMNNETIGHVINGTRYNETILYEYFANLSNIMDNETIRTILSGGTGIVYDESTGIIIATAINGSGGSGQSYMVIDIRNSKYNGIIWDITDAEADGVDIQASTTTELIFGRNIQ